MKNKTWTKNTRAVFSGEALTVTGKLVSCGSEKRRRQIQVEEKRFLILFFLLLLSGYHNVGVLHHVPFELRPRRRRETSHWKEIRQRPETENFTGSSGDGDGRGDEEAAEAEVGAGLGAAEVDGGLVVG